MTLVNGKVAQKEVKWDQTGLDLSKPGINTLKGAVAGTKLTASVNVVVAAPMVTGVSAINAKQIVVKFNKEVFSAENVVDQTGEDAQNPANYTLNGTPATKAVLSADKKSVTLTFASAEADNKVLVVEKIATSAKDKDGNVIKTEKYSQVFSYTDTVAPQVVGTSYANGVVTVQFSEEIGVKPSVVRVNGTPVTASDISIDGTDKTKVNINVAGLASGSSASLYVAGAKDTSAAQNEITLYNGTVIVPTADTGKPQIVGVQVTGQNTAKITLSEDINETSVSAKLQQGATQTSVTLVEDTTDTTGKTYILTVPGLFTGASTSESFTLYVAAGAMHDLAATPNANELFSTSVTFNKDVTAPALVKSELTTGNKQFSFTFDESLRPVGDESAIIVKNNDGVKIPVNVSTALKTGDDKVYLVDLSADDSSIAAGTYTVTLPAGFFTDQYGNATKSAITSTFTVGTSTTADTVKPVAVVTNPASTKNVFDVAFHNGAVGSLEEVNSSALNLNNYSLDGNTLPDGTEIYFTSTAKDTVRIELPVGSVNIGDQTDGASAILTVANIQDKAGNASTAANYSVKVNDNTAATITNVQVLGTDVYVTFNEALTAPLALTDALNAFDVTVNGTPLTANDVSDLAAVPGNTKQVKFSLTNAPAATPVVKVKASQSALTDANGVAVK